MGVLVPSGITGPLKWTIETPTPHPEDEDPDYPYPYMDAEHAEASTLRVQSGFSQGDGGWQALPPAPSAEVLAAEAAWEATLVAEAGAAVDAA